MTQSTLGIQLTTIIYNFYLSSYCIFLFIKLFFVLIISSHIVFNTELCLRDRSVYPNICAAFLRRPIRQCSFRSVILTSFDKGRWFSFSFPIWSAILNFSTSPRHTAFGCSYSLILVGSISGLGTLYHNCMGWRTHNSWSCCILLGASHRNDIFKESCHSCNHMNNISFESFRLGPWHTRLTVLSFQILCSVVRSWFLQPNVCVTVTIEVIFKLLICSWYASL